MARKVTVNTFASTIKDILQEYEEETVKDVNDVVKTVARKGALAVKNTALDTFEPSNLSDGRYGTGWTYTLEERRIGMRATIHNEKYPGLPHLLENGHAKRGGGRTRAFVHIRPIEEEIERNAVALLKVTI